MVRKLTLKGRCAFFFGTISKLDRWTLVVVEILRFFCIHISEVFGVNHNQDTDCHGRSFVIYYNRSRKMLGKHKK
jgi:hypothetical protein